MSAVHSPNTCRISVQYKPRTPILRLVDWLRREPQDRAAEKAPMDSPARDSGGLAVSTLVHRLSTHLTVAVGYAELLSVEPTLPEALRPSVAVILQAAVDAGQTLAQLQGVLRARGHSGPS